MIYLLISLLSSGGGRTRTSARTAVAVVNSVQKFWDDAVERSNRQYEYVDTVFFTDQVE